MKIILISVLSAIALFSSGCNSQSANESANQASQKVTEAASNIANKTGEIAQNVNRAAGPTINDATITAKVKARLLADSITGTTIDTTNGVVTLTGAVATAELKSKAEKHAQEIEGVKSVKNELVIKK